MLDLLLKPRNRKPVSLSTYFPAGTQYFYGYPVGKDSGFLNEVPPDIEELVAARALSCAGDHVEVVGFAASSPPVISNELVKKFDIPYQDQEKFIVLPTTIDSNLKGKQRNEVIKDSLRNLSHEHQLVMAQPYTSQDIKQLFQIPPKITTWLNDKQNMSAYINPAYMPARYGSYANGAEFVAALVNLELPFVVKVGASSSGDGVYICTDQAAVNKARHALQDFKESIFVEAYIDAQNNYGIHFGVPYDSRHQIDFLGINEQLTTAQGEFLGGIIRSNEFPGRLTDIKNYLINEILPVVRQAGWYGVGCFDVLTDKQGNGYFIDCNFRMTGMSAYHFLVANGKIKSPLAGFTGTFIGSQPELERALLPYAGTASADKIMQIITLSFNDNCWRFNAALLFDSSAEIPSKARLLLEAGITSDTLSALIK